MNGILFSSHYKKVLKAGAPLVGGKAMGLARLELLKDSETRVPPWAVLFSENRSQEQLNVLWSRISENGKYPVAVRSSASAEDSGDLSFAGQFESYLNIRSRELFSESVTAVVRSLDSKRIVEYCRKNGVDINRIRMAVVVQRMIEPESAGVVFSRDPVTGTDKIRISSSLGLGEGVVNGDCSVDEFLVSRSGDLLESETADKDFLYRYKSGGGTERVQVSSEQKSTVSLSPDQLKRLALAAVRAEKKLGFPADLEFAFSRGELYWLQARPITSSVTPDPTLRIWDNSNIVESYSGITQPLTFSFIRNAYASVYRQFCEIAGISDREIEANRYIFFNMLGIFRGRVFYNLLNWYRLMALLPGYRFNREFMEQMMGVSKRLVIPGPEKEAGTLNRLFIQLPRLLFVVFRLMRLYRTFPRRMKRFLANFYNHYNRYKQLDLSALTPVELLALRRDLEENILAHWKEPIINDIKAMIFYGVLKKLTVKWGLDTRGQLQNDLLLHSGDIKSEGIVTGLMDVADVIKERGLTRIPFIKADTGKALDLLLKDDNFDKARRVFEEYLDKYGIRSLDEMKLESIPLKDDPLFCIHMIQSYLQNRGKGENDSSGGEASGSGSLPDSELSPRLAAERLIRKKLKGFKRGFYRWILKETRASIRDREIQRFCRAEIYGIVRDLFLSIGRQWKSSGILSDHRHIFFLEWEEIEHYIEGASPMTDMEALARSRKIQYELYEKNDLPDRFETTGEIYSSPLPSSSTGSSENLSGTGCCPGIVRGEVLVLQRPDLSTRLKGQIIVAPQTDPGWVVIFPSISGLIIQKGSMLSHSAIVAREMGIPTIVGVPGAVSALKSGDEIEMDGRNGTITVLKTNEKSHGE